MLILYLGGGIGFTGATTCVSGYVCTVSNPYYSQCIPGTAASTTTATSATSVTSATSAKSTTTGTGTATSSGSATTGTVVGNPFSGMALYANPYYASEISTSAIPSLTGAMATKAAAVADVPTFVWL